MINFKRFQFNWLIVIILLVVIGFGTKVYIYQLGENKMDIGAYIFFLIIFGGFLLSLYGTTLIVTDKQIKIKFGIGLFVKRIELNSITSVKSVKLLIYMIFLTGGVTLIPNGMIYYLSGSHAIEIKIKGKKTMIQIGTTDSENFKSAIEENIRNIYKTT